MNLSIILGEGCFHTTNVLLNKIVLLGNYVSCYSSANTKQIVNWRGSILINGWVFHLWSFLCWILCIDLLSNLSFFCIRLLYLFPNRAYDGYAGMEAKFKTLKYSPEGSAFSKHKCEFNWDSRLQGNFVVNLPCYDSSRVFWQCFPIKWPHKKHTADPNLASY